jgi:hypothetical protein
MNKPDKMQEINIRSLPQENTFDDVATKISNELSKFIGKGTVSSGELGYLITIVNNLAALSEAKRYYMTLISSGADDRVCLTMRDFIRDLETDNYTDCQSLSQLSNK